MNRRNFLKLMAAGATPLTISVLCNLPLETLVSSPTAKSTFTPKGVTPTETALLPSATPTIGPVPAPGGGLNGNANYHLHSGCNPVTDLSVTMEITKEIVSDIGFSFQLNCYSPQNANCVWQQYGFTIRTTDNSPITLNWFIDNWPSPAFTQSLNLPPGYNIINNRDTMLSLSGDTVPAGYKFTINLKYDKKENVNGVTFIIVDSTGKSTTKDIMLESLNYASPTHNGKQVTADGLAPIYAFELNTVGPVNGKDSYFSSGAGTITYSASSSLYVANKDPNCTAVRSTITMESSNCVYAPLLAGPSKTITQSFEAEVPHLFQPGKRFVVSQQYGINQTDLFAIDGLGQLSIFYVLESGHWHSSKPLGAVGMAVPGAPVAASQHFGVDNQTDVFLVDQNGKLNLFWVSNNGAWNGPQSIGPSVMANAVGANLAVSQQFGVNNQTDVFLVDKNGQLNVFWAIGSGNWHGPQTIGPTGLAHPGAPIAVSKHFGNENQTDVFVVDTNGQLNVFSIVGSGNWSGPKTIGPSGLTRSAAYVIASQRFGKNNQTDVYLADVHGQLNVFSANGSDHWGGPQTIGSSGLTVSGAAIAVVQKPGTTDQTEVFVFDKNGQLNIFTADNSGQWSGPVTVSPQNVAPAGSPVVASQQFGVPNRTDVFVIDQSESQIGSAPQGWPALFWSTGADQWNGPKELMHDL
jgi:hypothetical protein